MNLLSIVLFAFSSLAAGPQTLSFTGTYRSGQLLDSNHAQIDLTISQEFVHLQIQAPQASCLMEFADGSFVKTVEHETLPGLWVRYDLYRFPVEKYCGSRRTFGQNALLTIYKDKDGNFESAKLTSETLTNKFIYFQSK